jgi:hypothetical protein
VRVEHADDAGRPPTVTETGYDRRGLPASVVALTGAVPILEYLP